MRSDEGSCDNFFFGPSVLVPYREPFANERYMFGDSQYHACGKYAALEKRFFSENEEIMREIFFDTNNLLGVDSDEDVASSDVSSLEWTFLRVDFHISRPCLGSLGPFHLAKIKMGGSWNLPGYLDQYPFCQKKFFENY